MNVCLAHYLCIKYLGSSILVSYPPPPSQTPGLARDGLPCGGGGGEGRQVTVSRGGGGGGGDGNGGRPGTFRLGGTARQLHNGIATIATASSLES